MTMETVMSVRRLSLAEQQGRSASMDCRHSRTRRSPTMNLIDRFRRDETGNVVITFALLLPVVVAGVGAAVSYSTGSAARTSMQNSLDAAVLAAAASSDLTDASSASAIDTASKYFENNVGTFARNSAKEIAATFAVSSLTISGQATGSLANPFGGVIGSKTY